MQAYTTTTRFGDRPSRQAWLILIATLGAISWCLVAALFQSSAPAPPPEQGGSDLRLYRSIVERVHAGENYYDAAGKELREQGYPSASLFNWRTPIYAWLLGSLPSPLWGQVIVSLLALVTLLMAYTLILRTGGPWRAIPGAFLLFGVFHWCIDGDAFFAQELWAGILLVGSVCAYGLGRRRLGMAAGLAALFFRELALPYALLALVLAWRTQRRREALAWLAGLACYGLFLGYHGWEVAHHVTGADRASSGWLTFGGPAFILATCRMNGFLFALPVWVSAFYLPLALLGLAGWRGEQSARLAGTIGCYVAAFAIIGQPFNNYWGLLYVGLLPFGLVWTPSALRDLLSSALRSPLAPQKAMAGTEA